MRTRMMAMRMMTKTSQGKSPGERFEQPANQIDLSDWVYAYILVTMNPIIFQICITPTTCKELHQKFESYTTSGCFSKELQFLSYIARSICLHCVSREEKSKQVRRSKNCDLIQSVQPPLEYKSIICSKMSESVTGSSSSNRRMGLLNNHFDSMPAYGS